MCCSRGEFGSCINCNMRGTQLGTNTKGNPLSDSGFKSGQINFLEAEEGGVKKLINVKLNMGVDKNVVITLIDTGDSCNVIPKFFCKKHGLVVRPLQSEMSGFNGDKSTVQGLVMFLVEVGKWQAGLTFYVVSHGSYPMLVYPCFKQLQMTVDYVMKNLVGEDGDDMLCRVVKEGKKTLFGCLKCGTPKVHVILTREVKSVKVTYKDDMLIFPLANYLVLHSTGVQKCGAIICCGRYGHTIRFICSSSWWALCDCGK